MVGVVEDATVRVSVGDLGCRFPTISWQSDGVDVETAVPDVSDNPSGVAIEIVVGVTGFGPLLSDVFNELGGVVCECEVFPSVFGVGFYGPFAA